MSHAAPAASSPPTDASGALRVTVLGPLEVHAGGENRTPTAPMARRAMAVLLLSANRLVSTSALIEELWDAEPPRLARKTVQTYVYQIRQALKCPAYPSERLETGPNGYRLVLRPGELDLWEFEHRAARARGALSAGTPEEAAALLREGLALWRGDPFAGLETGPLLAAQIDRIAESRLGALELRIDTDLQLGRHQGLVGELRTLTADHPLNEQLAAQLMVAAHRAGQRSTALDAFTRLRRHLVDELGIEPSERLQTLQREVLSEALPTAPPSAGPRPATLSPDPAAPGGPAVAAVTTVTAVTDQMPLDTADFVGRADELALIRARLDSPGPRVMTVLGPAGVGKTALAVRAAHLLGGEFPDGLLHAPLHDTADRPRRATAVLRSLLGGAGLERAQLPDDPDELAGTFRALTRGRSLLILLDDAAGTDQVLPLLPGGDSLVIVTSRVRLPGLPGARDLTLGPLSTDAAATLFAQVAGEARTGDDPAALRQVVTLMGNFPLTLRAVGEKFAAWPFRTLPDLALRLLDENHLAAELDDETCDVLARTYGALARLSPPLRRALHLLAEAGGGSFDIPRAQVALAADTWSTQTTVGQLLDRHVVTLEEQLPGAPLTFRVPDLIRLSAVSQVAAADHVLPRVGGAVAEVLTAVG